MYVLFAMRVDYDGEGGILALMALLGVKNTSRRRLNRPGVSGSIGVLLLAGQLHADRAVRQLIVCVRRKEALPAHTLRPRWQRLWNPWDDILARNDRERGSIATVSRCPRHVRFSSDSD
jgi:hypothetical protein